MKETNYSGLRDEELAALSQSGDRAAEEALLVRYKEKIRIRSGLYFMLGGDRNDIIQEGMIGLFSAIRNYSPEGGASFATFAELCVNRRIIKAIDGAGRRKHSPLNESVSLDTDVQAEGGLALLDTLSANSDTDPEAKLLLSETISLMLEDDSRLLSPMERNVLELLISDCSKEEIAEKTGKSLKSVNNTITRIRAKISPFFDQ